VIWVGLVIVTNCTGVAVTIGAAGTGACLQPDRFDQGFASKWAELSNFDEFGRVEARNNVAGRSRIFHGVTLK